MTSVADLHVHSSLSSEGRHSPQALVRLAADRGVRALAIADHDTMAGYQPAASAGRELGVEVIPCVELTVSTLGIEVGLLAYFLDPAAPEVAARLETAMARRVKRARHAVDELNRLGFEISYEQAQAANPAAVPSTAAVLEAARRLPANRQLVAGGRRPGPPVRLGAGADTADPEADVIAFIRRNGGVPVLAGGAAALPAAQRYAVLTTLAMHGLCGVEVYSPRHSAAEVTELARCAQQLGLEATAGSGLAGLGAAGAEEIGDLPGVPRDLVSRLRSHHHLY